MLTDFLHLVQFPRSKGANLQYLNGFIFHPIITVFLSNAHHNELIKEMRKLYTCMYNKKKRLEVSKNYMHVFGRYMDMFVCTIFIFHLFLMHFIL